LVFPDKCGDTIAALIHTNITLSICVHYTINSKGTVFQETVPYFHLVTILKVFAKLRPSHFSGCIPTTPRGVKIHD